MLLTLTLFLVALGLAFALGWILGRQRVQTPEAPRLTFEITIPPDTPPGDNLYLTGTFNRWNPADPTYQLQRTADLATATWMFSTTHPLEYKITRGSWLTVEKGRGNVELHNHVVTPTHSMTVQMTVVEWADRALPDATIYDPRVERIVFNSPTLGVTRTFYVYVPPETRSDAQLRVPSVYLLRGHEREWINKREDQSRGGQRNIIDVYEELRAANQIGPLVLVFPGMTSFNGTVHSLGINMRAPELAHDPSIGSGRFEDFVFEDMIPYIETHYPVLRGGDHRAIDGFSLGGFMSVNLALRHPGGFSSVGTYDGLYFWDDPDGKHTIAITDTVFARPLFDADFGVPRDRTFAADHNPLTILRSDGAAVPQIQWLIEYGPQVAEPNVNYFRGARLDELIAERGGVNRLSGALPNGIHTWLMADEHMRRSLPLHWERIKP